MADNIIDFAEELTKRLPQLSEAECRQALWQCINKTLCQYRADMGGRLLSQMELHDLFLLVASHYWPERGRDVAELGLKGYVE